NGNANLPPQVDNSQNQGNTNPKTEVDDDNNQGNGNANLPPQVDNSNNQGNGNTNPKIEVDSNQPPKSKTTEVKTYTSNDTNLSIPDLGTLFSTLAIPDRGSILDLNIQLGITHERSNDIDVFLKSPDGKSVKLFANVGGNSNKLGKVTLNDDASLPISAISNPNATIFRPEGNLSTFNGLDLSGTWTLEVRDTNKQKTGTLKSWSMIITKSN
ncbi:proprotein convertase P-domain-containing protein, partial [Microcoleus sp. Pol17C6]